MPCPNPKCEHRRLNICDKLGQEANHAVCPLPLSTAPKVKNTAPSITTQEQTALWTTRPTILCPNCGETLDLFYETDLFHTNNYNRTQTDQEQAWHLDCPHCPTYIRVCVARQVRYKVIEIDVVIEDEDDDDESEGKYDPNAGW